MLSDDDVDAHCRTPCLSGADCDTNELCADLDGVNYGACLPAPTPVATKLLGEPCNTSGECVTGLCAGDASGAVCSTPCDSHLQCPRDGCARPWQMEVARAWEMAPPPRAVPV